MAVLTRIEPTTAKDTNIPFGELYLCGTDNLQQHIEDLFILQQPERMTSARIQKISDALAPSILFRMSLKNYLQEMDASAADILHLLPAVYESTGGIRVEGCAGTGKT